MAYLADDPRSALRSSTAASSGRDGPVAPCEVATFYEREPDLDNGDGSRAWSVRGQNFTLLLDAVDGARTLTRDGQPDEWALLLPDPGLRAAVRWNGGEVDVPGRSLTFIPAGDGEVRLQGAGRAVRLFTAVARDLAERAYNAASYARAHADIPPFAPWPDAPEARVRSYGLDVEPEPGRFGRIFRCSTLMVNVLEPNDGPRDPTKLSPHAHDDFEQCSLALEGEYVHHLRWPWTPDRTTWRSDEHLRVGSPSVTVIPARAVHTSEPVAAGRNQLVDIFCPPRTDFSDMPGWVLNADDYPLRPRD
ncbi:MAG TPA: hypothetical protein VNS09_26205 [Solirubrobacter sp.]|nr:hypothetical protein [Solirubrobacter sp.]